jgi:hypothetical protein
MNVLLYEIIPMEEVMIYELEVNATYGRFAPYVLDD